MRLLRCATLQFETFEGDNVPPYAILSHRWGKEEVSYQEMVNGQGRLKAGYNKIKRCGEIAAKNSPALEFFWVDTCCIDKSSSTELSEAINSMYTWYKNASVCYAYLSDVSATCRPHPVHRTVVTFGSSRWFSRGWTLQELIAPSSLIFFSKEWKRIGTKETLKEHIQEITGISIKALEGADLGLFSVAERMSWASKRKTTRIEDMAYSLMGIFDVNMPLIYGEREKAFLRLQEEIMKSSDDQSLFAWVDESARGLTYSGLLARSPAHFAESANISSLGYWGKSGAFSDTNKGLRVELFLIPYMESIGIYRASLDCLYKDSMVDSPAILLMSVTNSTIPWTTTYDTQFVRVDASRIDKIGAQSKTLGDYRTVFVKHNHILQQGPRELSDLILFRIINKRGVPCGVYPPEQYNPQSDLFSTPLRVGKVGGLVFRHDNMHYMIILGLSESSKAWTAIIPQLSSGSDNNWTSYQTTGREVGDSSVDYEIDDLPFHISAIVTTVSVYGTLVFEVRVSAGRAGIASLRKDRKRWKYHLRRLGLTGRVMQKRMGGRGSGPSGSYATRWGQTMLKVTENWAGKDFWDESAGRMRV